MDLYRTPSYWSEKCSDFIGRKEVTILKEFINHTKLIFGGSKWTKSSCYLIKQQEMMCAPAFIHDGGVGGTAPRNLELRLNNER